METTSAQNVLTWINKVLLSQLAFGIYAHLSPIAVFGFALWNITVSPKFTWYEFVLLYVVSQGSMGYCWVQFGFWWKNHRAFEKAGWLNVALFVFALAIVGVVIREYSSLTSSFNVNIEMTRLKG